MATISENLQILKDSTDAIKQAIIDKGGDVTGDISTWANVISGLSGGGSNEEEITFRGTLTPNMNKIIISGKIDSKPKYSDSLHFCALGFRSMGGIVYKSQSIVVTDTIDITLDMDEPISDAGNTNFIIIGSNYNGRCPIWKVNFIENTSQGGMSGGDD